MIKTIANTLFSLTDAKGILALNGGVLAFVTLSEAEIILRIAMIVVSIIFTILIGLKKLRK